jgi:hypothetical protein
MRSRAHMGESIAYLDAVRQDWGWRRWGPEQAERVGLLKESWRQSSFVLLKGELTLLSRGPTSPFAAQNCFCFMPGGLITGPARP